MKLIKYLVFLILGSLLFSSCGSKKKASKTHTKILNKEETVVEKKNKIPEKEVAIIREEKKDVSTENYIKEFAPIAVTQMKMYKIPASITLAQGILESRSGNSSLTKVSNNHFGIKCHKKWGGSRTYYDDDKKQECFRVYDDPSKSFQDHALFLTQRQRYADLFKLNPGDYKAWAKGLKKAGYATDKQYPKKLINIIEKYELYKYDESVLGVNHGKDVVNLTTEKTPLRVSTDNSPISTKVYVVQKGDGLYSISKRSGISIAEIRHINHLESNDIQVGQELLLQAPNSEVVESISKITQDTTSVVQDTIQPVNEVEITQVDTMAESTTKPLQTKPDYHIVQQGETLYQIAYKYDLEIPDLRKWNGIHKNEIRIGQRIFLRNPREIRNKNLKSSSLTSPDDSVVIDADSHVVAPKETLYSISKMYGTTVKRLMELNQLSDYNIRIGQVLKVR